ncbi:hypothetical protein YUYDRAFT_05046 [Streptomyces sp. ScaeMP-e48]|uniref:hypothetical protein n=1 Tax=Streptomyces TaxID=1883 RepID=UPI000823EB4D|nr:hypothetical protein [Streptomyces sp. ScaeMP-e48]SCK40919.1 hypothetical protein YUYDRAFT_05046 [Streptomyces sp. ScaeMP-e48]
MIDPSVPLPHQRSAEAPSPAGKGLDALRERMLIQVSPARVSQVHEHIDTARSGLVLCGKEALRSAARLRREKAYSGALLVDPAAYEMSAATEDDPFPHVDADSLPFDDALDVSLIEQRAVGVTAPMTPTGYIRAEDSDALKAAVLRVVALDDPSVVFAVPIDVAWLRDEEPVRQLIALLRLVQGPKAIMLGGQMDPLARHSKAVGHLRRVIEQVPDAALLRTDLAAFGALAAGAAFTAFGTSGKLRHIIAPGEKAKTGNGGFPTSPHVLYPELMSFFLGTTLAKRFAASPAPACPCAACLGVRALDSFTSLHSPLPAAAAAHNVSVLMGWLRALSALPEGPARERWWYERCKRAVDHYPLVNAIIAQPNAFKVPEQLKRWALAAPAPTTSIATSPDGQRTR